MSDESRTVLSRKVAVQRRPDGEPLGVALWISSENAQKLFDGEGVRLSLSTESGELVLEKNPPGKGVRLQELGDRPLGVAVWIPASVLPELGFPLDDELSLKLRIPGKRTGAERITFQDLESLEKVEARLSQLRGPQAEHQLKGQEDG